MNQAQKIFCFMFVELFAFGVFYTTMIFLPPVNKIQALIFPIAFVIISISNVITFSRGAGQ